MVFPQSAMNYDMDRDGFCVLPHVISDDVLAHLIQDIDATIAAQSHEQQRRQTSVHSLRNVIEGVPSVRDFINSPSMRALVEPILGPNCSPVRGILFDKVPGANWKVPWHQDLSIAVCERIEIEGFGPWSQKTGILHVQPSARVLENMLTLRLHLDDCFADNGPLRVLPASHRDGKLSAQQIAEWRRREEEVVCALPRGGVLLMRPLLLHASSASQTPGHRRVLHIEWAAHKLPGGLQWCA